MADDLSDAWAEIRRVQARLRRLEVGTPQQDASVSRGAFEILSDEGLLVGEPGSSTGSARVYGTLWVTGVENVDGQLNITGTLDVTGDTTIGGLAKLLSDLRVQAPGRILTDGPIPVEINSDGEVKFGDAVLKGNAGGISMVDGTVVGRSVNVNSSGVTMQDMSALINITSALIQIAGAPLLISSTSVKMPNLPEMNGTGLPSGTLWRDPTTKEVFYCAS